mmetsp:Transcript_19893/g.43216  ORF Transcript_19893/g.43216 Transcript_19893/m.43216 type:complete len:241 (-) Transcript_19893:1312-2034(-)
MQGLEPEHAVQKGVEGGRSGRKEGEPPPAVVFRTELAVDQEKGDLGAGNDENEKDNEGESKDVVVLVHPQGRHDEEKFDVGRGKGNDTGHQGSDQGVHEGLGRRNGAGNRGGDGGELDGFLLVPKVGTQKDQRDGDSAPHGGDDDNVQKGCRCGRVQEEEDDVEKHKDAKGDSGEQEGGDNGAQLPETALKGLVETAADVSRQNSGQDVEGENAVHEGTTAGRVQESNRREANGQENGET